MEITNWCHIYHNPDNSIYNSCFSLDKALKELGIKLFLFTYKNPNQAKLPTKEFIKKNKIDVCLTNITGETIKLDEQISIFKKENPGIILINFLGDEPQTRHVNFVRALRCDIALSPDANCVKYWQSQGINCKWWTHWADLDAFNNKNIDRDIFLGTTMGNRRYSRLLKFILGSSFVNKRVEGYKNAQFFSRIKIAFQYARFQEITRRIFEASACGCCVITNKLPKHTKINSIFIHNESILYFDNTFHLLFLLLKLTLNKSKSKRIARNAEYLVKHKHSSKNRAEEVYNYALEYYQSLKKN